MPRKTVTVRVSIVEGNDVFLTSQILTADNTPIQQGDILGTMTVDVYDISSAGEGRDRDRSIFNTTISTTAGGPDSGASITNTYQKGDGSYWGGKDGVGYNFVYQLQWDSTGNAGPYMRGGHSYHVWFQANLTAGAKDFGSMRWLFIIDVGYGELV